ncbi:YD repeat protein OS=Isosphaera pallida (strain ATCC 43644 / DSM 9630 / IS1B) GN=Isop_2419 PE=4 SV=1: PT-HINT [Tuwongella immobilis]|uniref:Hint domain-containing protein n=2 Tax=Tuwongella immobilis TaxID=692036 RepID=A0A6C2YHD3_9BACT|nr:YD repeat protein OS=Isosphaera pallida (strain ATCC 43644 / DSM 9630 / IS1B) GN=Isop_2419 PE=4 SV=1: PT-HINT [Tuwongella immobilis]VTR97072.1 YD repeat protein OS=Isosphaera pallida (strain ATCC 43644 / DSM 9630 / IS1B) GN=Isop_2419 PE=4 SV=1: PT-HINT [Tuwongella immobilis]
MADGTSKPIKQFIPGDAILRRDETDLNDPITVQVVEAVFEPSAIIFELRVAGQLIEPTAEHPFWVVDRGWTPVWDLTIGDCLTTMNGETVSVEGVHETDRRETVYNLRVAEFHTDAVGCDEWGFSVWAHHVNCVTIPTPTQPGQYALATKGPDGALTSVYKPGTQSEGIAHASSDAAKVAVESGGGMVTNLDAKKLQGAQANLVGDLRKAGATEHIGGHEVVNQ